MPECTHWIQTCYDGTNYTSDQHIVVRAPCHEVESQWQQQATLITPWENIPCQVMHNWPKKVWNEISKLPAGTSIQQLCKQARLISPWENIPCHIFFLQAWGLICVFETSSQDSGTCAKLCIKYCPMMQKKVWNEFNIISKLPVHSLIIWLYHSL